MGDWEYCQTILPKVSRTFALNISILRGSLHRSILVAYLFCRIIDTVEDAAETPSQTKIDLLLEFYILIRDKTYRKAHLSFWVDKCKVIDGTQNDLDLLIHTPSVFNIFDSLPRDHQDQIVPSVSRMAQGMAYFIRRFHSDSLALLENEEELEEYCYFVAGCVGEMLQNLFIAHIPNLSVVSLEIMQQTAISFGLGLQITNIAKDFLVDRKRGWSYIPKSLIIRSGLTVEEFSSGKDLNKNLNVIQDLLDKTLGHLQDALKFTLAIPRMEMRIRLFCIWPLWMAMETVAVLRQNKNLLTSEDPVKISRSTVKKILRRTPLYAFSNTLLTRSFNNIFERCFCDHPRTFNLMCLRERLDKIFLEPPSLSV